MCKNHNYTFKNEDFFSRNTILDDYLMFRVIISALTSFERMKRWFINFDVKEYSNKNHMSIDDATKRKNLSIKKKHYIIICKTYQFHDEKNEREKLHRIFANISIVKANEKLNEECVNQNSIKKTILEKWQEIEKINCDKCNTLDQIIDKRRQAKNIISKKSRKKLRNRKKSQIEELNSENSQRIFKNNSIISIFNESNVKSLKTRSRTRKIILKELKQAIKNISILKISEKQRATIDKLTSAKSVSNFNFKNQSHFLKKRDLQFSKNQKKNQKHQTRTRYSEISTTWRMNSSQWTRWWRFSKNREIFSIFSTIEIKSRV